MVSSSDKQTYSRDEQTYSRDITMDCFIARQD